VVFLLAGALMLGACATKQLDEFTLPPLQHSGPEVEVADVDVLAVSPAMEAFLERYVLVHADSYTRFNVLTQAVSGFGILGFVYDESLTLTAEETFKQHSGNCIGFANMMVALARRSGLKANYQEVVRRPVWSNHEQDTVLLVKHINVVMDKHQKTYVVDASGIEIHPNAHRKLISDNHAKALYLNNIGAEALLVNDLPTAYAYMAKAYEVEPTATDALVNLGVVYGRNDQLDDARLVFERVLEIDDYEYSALSNLYEIYLLQEDMEAVARLEPRVENYRRKNPYYLLKLSDEAVELEQYDESISLLKSAIRKKKDDHALYLALARTQYLRGNTSAAQSSLKRARKVAPDEVVAYYDQPMSELLADQ
jgi:tetratricopeptide (TPR) repeat protein